MIDHGGGEDVRAGFRLLLPGGLGQPYRRALAEGMDRDLHLDRRVPGGAVMSMSQGAPSQKRSSVWSPIGCGGHVADQVEPEQCALTRQPIGGTVIV